MSVNSAGHCKVQSGSRTLSVDARASTDHWTASHALLSTSSVSVSFNHRPHWLNCGRHNFDVSIATIKNLDKLDFPMVVVKRELTRKVILC